MVLGIRKKKVVTRKPFPDPEVIEEEPVKIKETAKDKAIDRMQNMVPNPPKDDDEPEQVDNIDKKTLKELQEEAEEQVEELEEEDVETVNPEIANQAKIDTSNEEAINCTIIAGQKIDEGFIYTIQTTGSIGELGEDFEIYK